MPCGIRYHARCCRCQTYQSHHHHHSDGWQHPAYCHPQSAHCAAHRTCRRSWPPRRPKVVPPTLVLLWPVGLVSMPRCIGSGSADKLPSVAEHTAAKRQRRREWHSPKDDIASAAHTAQGIDSSNSAVRSPNMGPILPYSASHVKNGAQQTALWPSGVMVFTPQVPHEQYTPGLSGSRQRYVLVPGL